MRQRDPHRSPCGTLWALRQPIDGKPWNDQHRRDNGHPPIDPSLLLIDVPLDDAGIRLRASQWRSGVRSFAELQRANEQLAKPVRGDFLGGDCGRGSNRSPNGGWPRGDRTAACPERNIRMFTPAKKGKHFGKQPVGRRLANDRLGCSSGGRPTESARKGVPRWALNISTRKRKFNYRGTSKQVAKGRNFNRGIIRITRYTGSSRACVCRVRSRAFQTSPQTDVIVYNACFYLSQRLNGDDTDELEWQFKFGSKFALRFEFESFSCASPGGLGGVDSETRSVSVGLRSASG